MTLVKDDDSRDAALAEAIARGQPVARVKPGRKRKRLPA
jgi:hypothetical protein